MKKYKLVIILLFIALIIAIFSILTKEKETNLKKVTLADTTLTSRTYMS